MADALGAQRVDEALRAARVLHASYPDDESVLSLRASCEQQAGHHALAVPLLERLSAQQPGVWQYWNNLGNALRALGHIEQARAAYEQALSIDPHLNRVRANLGLLLLNEGKPSAAAQHLRSAASTPDATSGMRVWAAVASHAAGESEQASAWIENWSQWPRDSDEAWLELGWLLAELGRYDEAERVLAGRFDTLLGRIRAGARRAMLLERINQTDRAAQVLRDLPPVSQVADPDAGQELLHATALLAMRDKNWGAARDALQGALNISTSMRGRAALYFTLARACDRLGDSVATLAALDAAHRLVARTSEPNRGRWMALLTTRASAEPRRGQLHKRLSPAPQSPVFVVGFPRSGTTLLEQMLAAHPDFSSIDERSLVLAAIGSLRAQGIAYPHDLELLSEDTIGRLRTEYWRAADALVVRRPGQRLVDKNPLNMLALPMIATLFPRASLIICRRHPCDVILSCYMQPFADPEVAAMCASLERLARAYAAFDSQFREQAAEFDVSPYELRYEDLVADPQAALRTLGNYLSVADVTAMIAFAEPARRRGYISTPSYAQVIEPLNSAGIGRWLRYRAAFEPLLPLLEDAISHAGYTV